MKPGATTLARQAHPPLVEVGNDDQAVLVSFGALTFHLSSRGDLGVVIVRAEGHDLQGCVLPVESRGASDVRNQFEFRVEVQAEAG